VDEYLWPARNVAEYAYCPRLFYLMEVEGLHVHNADTESGMTVHKRVDSPSAVKEDDEPDPDRPKAARSLTLTSEKLRLTATLDIAEIQGKTATPVEYRKGRPRLATLAPPPDDPGEASEPILNKAEPWPTDRIQLGLQAILLEGAGYQVNQGVLYYAAERRRLTVLIDNMLRGEALETLEAAKKCACGPRPDPLINDSRCLRCSLMPICLPDEINAQRQAANGEPRRMWPARADGIQIVAQQEGVKLGIRGESLRFTDKEGKLLKETPLANVESVAVLGSVQVSTQALTTLADHGVPVAFLSSAGRLQAMVDPLDSVTAAVRRSQVQVLDNPQRALELCRAIIAAKITNQRTLLQRNNSAVPAIVLEDIAQQSRLAAAADSIDAARGHEGHAASLYFSHFAGMFKGPLGKKFDANGRKRRPPPDPINATISFAYTMLAHDCVSALRLARLEPTIGALHVSRPGRPALALDLMEPFRALIADSVAVSAFNRGELTEGHFLQTAAGSAMTDSGRKAFFSSYGRRMETEVTHPVFNYRLSYRRMIMLHARLIAAWMLGEIPALSFLTTR
jgi:CRISPR-associated protein Cas1